LGSPADGIVGDGRVGGQGGGVLGKGSPVALSGEAVLGEVPHLDGEAAIVFKRNNNGLLLHPAPDTVVDTLLLLHPLLLGEVVRLVLVGGVPVDGGSSHIKVELSHGVDHEIVVVEG